jgi:ABC-2 type transport system ATP-binding protein
VEEGTNVLLTTQYLDEADHLASQIAITDRGKTIAHTPAELKKRTGRNVIEVHVRDSVDVPDVASALTAFGDGAAAQIDESTRRVTVVVEGGTELLSRALAPLEQRSITLDDVALRPPRLDEGFLALTGQVLEQAESSGLRASPGSFDPGAARARNGA